MLENLKEDRPGCVWAQVNIHVRIITLEKLKA